MFVFLNVPAPPRIYTYCHPLSLHDAFPISNIELTEAMRDRHFENEDWQLRKGGGRYWASIAITPLYNDRGVHRGFGMVTRDLTERQRIDVLMDESRRITTFLAMLGHELRNPQIGRAHV